MTCRDCQYYVDSAEANKPRYGLEGYGFCSAAKTLEQRARFFHDSQATCWLPIPHFQERRKP